MKSDCDNTPTGIHWTFREVSKGKSGDIMAIQLVIAIALLAAYTVWSKGSTGAGVAFASLLNDILSLKANNFALDLCETIVLLIPVMIVVWPVATGIVMLVYNAIDRNLPRTPENLAEHDLLTKHAWTCSWSFIVGIFDFSAAFVLLNVLFWLIGGTQLSSVVQNLFTVLFTVICLVFADRRIKHTSSVMAGKLEGNRLVVAALLNGELDDCLPERYRNDLNRAKLATLVRIGISRTPLVVVFMAKGVELRSKVMGFSGFLASTIHAIFAAVTMGMATTIVFSLSSVGGQFATGRGKEYTESLRETSDKNPWFVIEVIAFVICCVATVATEIIGIS